MIDVATLYQDALAKHRNGDLSGAERDYRAILSTMPNHGGAWHFLGLVFHVQRKLELAVEYLERSLVLCDTKAVYHNNYGVVLKELHRLTIAKSAFQKAVNLDPNYVDAHFNLGLVFLQLNDPDAAQTAFETVVSLRPNHPEARQHLTELRFRQGRRYFVQEHFDQANQAFHEAASLPGGKELWRWKSLGFCPSVFPDEQSIDRYWTKLDKGLDFALDSKIDIDWRTLPEDGFTPSFNLPHLNRCCRSIKEKFAAIFMKAFPNKRPTLKETQRNRTKIRVGFVVTAGHHRGFLRVHSHLLAHLDPAKFDVCLICPIPLLDACRQAVRRNDIQWFGFPQRFDLVVQTLFDARCDILYHWKVGGGTLDYFLAMAQAAPIQCVSYGSHGTSGVAAIDYYISSSIIETPASASQYTERLVLLGSYATSHQHEISRQPATREEIGLPVDGAVYFCPHRIQKYHPCFDHYLRLILEKDSTGYLLLVGGKKNEPMNFFAERLRRSLGDTLFRRVSLISSMPLDVYRKYLSAVTCVLDSPAYAGDLTTHDAFDQGIPVVAAPGELLVQRYTSGLYRLMELEELVAVGAEAYSAIAVRLGKDAGYRHNIREKIIKRNGVVFSPMDTVRDYERFFENVCSSTY